MGSERSELTNFSQKIQEFVNDPEVSRFTYDAALVVIGFYFISRLGVMGFPFLRSAVIMGLYVILFAFLPPPESARLKSKPFETSVGDELTV